MSKTSGTVGRKGRVVEGPQITEGPGIIIRKGRGRRPGAGTVVLIAGISAKNQPRPGMKWNPDDQGREKVKVSERTVVPDQGEYAGRYKTSMENIDKVHTVQARANPVQIASSSRIGALGTHQYLSFVQDEPGPEGAGKPGDILDYSNILVDQKGLSESQGRSTTYHEYGHSYDSQSVNYRDDIVIKNRPVNNDFHRRRFQSENAFQRVKESGDYEYSRGDRPWDRFAKAVIKSKAYGRLMKEKNLKATDTTPDTDSFYWQRPREVFARAYQQFMGETTDPESLKSAKAYRGKGSNVYWSKADFKEIGMAIEDIFISRGEFVPEKSYYRKGVKASTRIVGNWGIGEG